MEIDIEVSAKHIHLSREHINQLFGEGYELSVLRELSQTGAFAAEESVDFVSEEGEGCKLRVVGPTRAQTQIELSRTDAFELGIEPSVRISGDIENTPGGFLEGPRGRVGIKEGVIVAKRHIHIGEEKAEEKGLEDEQIVSVEIKGERGLIFNEVIVRVGQNYKLSMHIDTDEANAAGIPSGGKGEIIV